MTIKTSEFNKLSQQRGEALLSIYMPIHSMGKEVRQNPVVLKNLLNEVESQADQLSYDKHKIRERVDVLRPMLDDSDFWQHMSKGLALFVSDEGTVIHRLPMSIDQLAVISDRFIVRPILPAVSSGENFLLLDLSEKRTRLAACTRDGARLLDDQDIPEHIADVVGWDVQQKSLQFHTEAQPTTRAAHGRAAIFHGQGAGGEEDERKELEQFLKAVDKGVLNMIGDDRKPLVVAGEERIVSMFKNLSHYPNIVDESLGGNYDHLDIERIHEMALPLVEPVLEAANREEHDQFKAAAHTDAAVTGLSDILPKARHGRVQTLYVDPRRAVWGRFDHERGSVEVHEDRTPKDEELLDLAIAHSLNTGAKIVPVESESLPGGEPVAALLRY